MEDVALVQSMLLKAADSSKVELKVLHKPDPSTD